MVNEKTSGKMGPSKKKTKREDAARKDGDMSLMGKMKAENKVRNEKHMSKRIRGGNIKQSGAKAKRPMAKSPCPNRR